MCFMCVYRYTMGMIIVIVRTLRGEYLIESSVPLVVVEVVVIVPGRQIDSIGLMALMAVWRSSS